MCVCAPVYAVSVPPAPVWVSVSVSSVNEGVCEGSADVLGRQAADRRDHVARKLSHAQRPSVLTSPPIELCSGDTETHMNTRRYDSVLHITEKDMFFILDNHLPF